MTSSPKKVIVVLIIIAILVLLYFAFFKGKKEEVNLVSSNTTTPVATDTVGDPALTQNFLSDLLNIKSIQLDDSIFAEPSFATLIDSTIILVPDGTEGRPNPFAPIGVDVITVVNTPAPTTTPTTTTPPATNNPTTPATTPPPGAPMAP